MDSGIRTLAGELLYDSCSNISSWLFAHLFVLASSPVPCCGGSTFVNMMESEADVITRTKLECLHGIPYTVNQTRDKAMPTRWKLRFQPILSPCTHHRIRFSSSPTIPIPLCTERHLHRNCVGCRRIRGDMPVTAYISSVQGQNKTILASLDPSRRLRRSRIGDGNVRETRQEDDKSTTGQPGASLERGGCNTEALGRHVCLHQSEVGGR